MPEYHSGRSHSSGFSKFSKIEVGRYSPNRIRKKADKPELSEEEELQKLREEFGKRIALSEQQDAATSARKHERLEQKQSKSQYTPILLEEAPVPSHERQGGEARVVDPSTFSSGTANPQRGLPQGSPEQSITASVAVAKQAYQQQDYANAYELFTQIVAQQPDNYEALFHLGVSATETGNHTVAVETTKKLIDSGHFTAQAFYFQGKSLEELGRQPEAAIAYKQAASEIPEAHQAFIRLEEERLLGGFSSQPAKSSNTDRTKTKQKTNTPAKQQQKKSFTASAHTTTVDIGELNSIEKLTKAVARSLQYLPDEVAEEIKAIFTPATLATMVGIFAAYIAAHATGIGQAMDIGMLIAGGIFFGLDAFAIFKDIAGFAGAINATSEEELDKAGQHLASAVAKIGIDAVMTLLTKKVADEVGKTADHVDRVDEVHAHSEGADNLDDAARNRLNRSLSDLTDAQKSQYLDAIAANPVLGQKLLEFDNFGSPQRLSNVLNAIDSVDDVERLKRVFDEDYLDSLVDQINPGEITMKTRYEWLLNDVADGNIQPNEFKERLSVLETTKNVQEAVESRVGSTAYVGNKLYSRNYAMGDYNITYTPQGTGAKPKTISDDYVSISGKNMPQEINSFSPQQTVDVEGAERKFIPAAPKTEKSRLPVTRRGADQDSERKLFAHILKELERISGQTINPEVKYKGKGFKGVINITSQMKPCNSCESIIKENLFEMFSNDIEVNVKYGVEFNAE